MSNRKKPEVGRTKASRATPSKGQATESERKHIAAEQFPRRSLEKVVAIASALHGTYAGKSATNEELASALNLSSNNVNFKYILWSATAYGVAAKGDGKNYSLGETGRKLVAPTYEGEDKEARVKAVLTPVLLSKFYTDYNGHPVPSDAHFPNVLETRYGIPRVRLLEAKTILIENARYAGILDEVDGQAPTIRLGGANVAGGLVGSIPVGTSVVGGSPENGESIDAGVDWSKVCFFITPIGDDGSENRRHADMMLKHLVLPAAEANDLVVVRADKIERSGLITQQILEHLARARLCVTDLSFNNPNVFYELGVRHMTLLPSIQLIRKGDRIPFDVSQGRTIVVDTSDPYTIMDRIESARRELSEHIHTALQAGSKGTEDNPIALYLPGIRVTL